MSWRIAIIAVMLGATVWPDSVEAQSLGHGYGGFLVGPYQVDADSVSGTSSSFGATAGIALLPWLDLELDLLRPIGITTREYTGRGVSFTGPGPPENFVLTHYTQQRRADAVFSVGVVFHPQQPLRRMMPRFFVGMANHFVRDRTLLEHLYLPPGVTLEQLNRVYPPEDWHRRNLGAISVGGSFAVYVMPRLVIAPDVRYDYGSIGDEINNWLRTSIRVVYRF